MYNQEFIRELCEQAEKEQDPERPGKLARVILTLAGTQRPKYRFSRVDYVASPGFAVCGRGVVSPIGG